MDRYIVFLVLLLLYNFRSCVSLRKGINKRDTGEFHNEDISSLSNIIQKLPPKCNEWITYVTRIICLKNICKSVKLTKAEKRCIGAFGPVA